MQDNTPHFVEGSDTRDFFRGGSGSDVIVGGDSADTLIGGDGDDTIIGDAVIQGQHFRFDFEALQPGEAGGSFSAELLVGGGGNDLIVGGGWDDSLVDNGRFNEQEVLNPDFVIEIFPSPIRNILWGGSGDDSLYAGAGSDTLGGGAGNDLIVGGTGRDVVFGGEGDDTVRAGSGNDLIWSGSGDDILSGERGNDTFYFSEGHGADRIEDFELGIDTLVLTNTVYGVAARTGTSEGLPALQVEETVAGGASGLLLTTGEGDSIFLVGLTSDDFSNLTIVT